MAAVIYKGSRYRIAGELPSIGSKAPDFSLVDKDLHDISLVNFRGRRKLIQTFPSIELPVSALALLALAQQSSAVDDLVMLTVSADLPFALSRFREREGIHDVIALSTLRNFGFGANYGVGIVQGPLEGLLAPAVLVIDEHDTVVHVELVKELSEEPDYAAALRALGIGEP